MAKHEIMAEPDPFLLRGEFPSPEDTLRAVVPRPAELATESVFVLDANVLLAPYKVGQEGVAKIADIYRALHSAKRLFVPKQALREFLRRRNVPLSETFDRLQQAISEAPTVSDIRLPLLDGRGEYDATVGAIGALKASIKGYKDSLSKLLGVVKDWKWDDSISALYRQVLVADSICDTRKPDEELLADLGYRSANMRPPGFKDGNKLDGGIGDVIIWHTILELGASMRKPVLFVSDEQKADWVVVTQKQPLATRPELVAEFHSASDGQPFAVITFPKFLEVMGADAETVGAVEYAVAYDTESWNKYAVRLADWVAVVRGACRQVAEELHSRRWDGLLSDPQIWRHYSDELSSLSRIVRDTNLLPGPASLGLDLCERAIGTLASVVADHAGGPLPPADRNSVNAAVRAFMTGSAYVPEQLRPRDASSL